TAGNDGAHAANLGPMTWAARKAFVRNAADFTWRNIEKDDGGNPLVEFKDTSHGEIVSWSWDFGDGSGTGTSQNPRHAYASNNTYTGYLNTTDTRGKQNSNGAFVTVTGTLDAVAQYTGASPSWSYRIDPNPIFSGDTDTASPPSYLYSTHAGNSTIVKVAV